MPRRLKVNVQIDRLPDAPATQLGLSLSAAIEADAADPTQAADLALVLPWRWSAITGGDWTPHSAASWRIWRLPAVGAPALELNWTLVSSEPAGFDAPLPDAAAPLNLRRRFRSRLDEEVGDILNAAGPRSLEAPRAGEAVATRTVFGLVESLTGLPHPVPSGTRVWAAVALQTAAAPGDRFIAMPIFEAGGDDYSPAAGAPAVDADGFYRLGYAAGPAVGGLAYMRPSLPWTAMEIGGNDPQRLIDLSTLLIRQAAGEAVEGSDWSSDLLARLSEAIDPGLQASAVFEAVLSDSSVSGATRAALQADLAAGGQDHFRAGLAALHAPAMTPRARGSRAATAVALNVLESLGARDPALWPDVAPTLLALAGAEAADAPPAATPAFVSVSRERLRRAAGLAPIEDSDDELPEDLRPDISAEAGLRSWLRAHWLAPPIQVAPVNDIVSHVHRIHRLSAPRTGVATTAQIDEIGLLDLPRMRGARAQSLEFSFRVTGPLPNNRSIVLTLGRPQSSPTTPRLTITLRAQGGGLSLQLSEAGASAPANGPAFQDGLLVVTLNLPAVDDPAPAYTASAVYSFAQQALRTGPIDISQTAATGRLGLTTRTWGAARAVLDTGAQLPAATMDERLKAQAWRTRLAAARYGADAAGLISGVIFGEEPDQGWRLLPLRERLQRALAAYIGPAFSAAFQAAKPATMADPDLVALWDRLRDAATAEARRAAMLLVPEQRGDLDRVTEDALPLSFAVDQLGDIDASEDLWSRLAGLGVLLGRRSPDGAANNEWWSLNAATLHVSEIADGVRAPLSQANAVPVRDQPVWAAAWARTARADPVPMVVGETNGARSAIIRYESRSLVAEMQGGQRATPEGPRQRVARRPEAFWFPTQPGLDGALRLPPLTFGRTYAITPYAIGHGGVNPPALRTTAANPNSPPPPFPGGASGSVLVDRNVLGGVVREATYLRTTPLGAPGVLSDRTEVWSAPDGVTPIQGDLPVRLPPVTTPQGVRARYFLDPRSGGALWPVSGADGVIVRLGRVAATGGGVLRLRIHDAGGELLQIDLPAAIANAGLELRVVGRTAQVWHAVTSPDDPAEDEPLFQATGIVVLADRSVDLWQGAAVELTASGSAVTYEPPMVWWTGMDGADRIRLSEKAVLPAEARPAVDNLLFLDGIGWGTPRPRRARLAFARPTTTHANYDRWINGRASGYGSADPQRIREALASAGKVAASPSPTQVLPDPAATALVLEVLQTFPVRRTVVEAQVVRRYAVEPPMPGAPGARENNGDGALEFDVLAIPQDVDATWDGKVLRLPGGTYEIRVYGAMPDRQVAYAPQAVEARSRFSPAAAAPMRGFLDGASQWWLGVPRVLPVEVASDHMPTFSGDRETPGFSLTLREPEGAARPVQVYLRPTQIDALEADAVKRYRALRLVNRVEFIEQHWDWRGVPQPQLEGAPSRFGDQGVVSPEVRNYVDQAFLWRDDDDRLRETRAELTRAHVYCGAVRWNPNATDERVRLMTRKLPFGKGSSLVRTAVRLTSRYAPMRLGSGDLQVSSHKPKNGVTTWWPLVLRDRIRALPRPLSRPALLMVLPLTEALMSGAAIPPLLAVFNEPMHANGNAADGLEAVVEVARHPFTTANALIPGDAAEEARLRTASDLVQAARARVAVAERTLAKLLALGSSATAAQQAQARQDLAAAQADCATAESDFTDEYAELVARGAEARWTKIVGDLDGDIVDLDQKIQAAEAAGQGALADALKLEVARFRTRRASAAASLAAAAAEAQDPSPAPFARTIPDPFAKHWPELAPDPVRTAAAASGEPVAIRCDGPVGYTFDPEGESGRYDHAGLLVSPVADRVRPWSMAKLRFRRVEAPELSEDPSGLHPAAWKDRPLDLPVAFGVPRLDGQVAATFSLQTQGGLSPFVRVTATRQGSDLSVVCASDLGTMRPWVLDVREKVGVELRVVVTARPKPDGKPWRPTADVAVQVRLDEPGPDTQQRLSEGAWLSIACLPVTTADEIASEVTPTLWSHVSAADTVYTRPLRASDFTPGVWCQFTADMSRVRLIAKAPGQTGGERDVDQVIENVSDNLFATPTADGKSLTLGVKNLAPTQVALLAEGAPDRDSQLEERLYLVATRTTYDANDRLRERPVAIFEAPAVLGSPVLGKPVWALPGAGPEPFRDGRGRLRILHVLRGRTKADGGFEDRPASFPCDFFGLGSEGDPEWPDDPPDAAGQVLGVSPPFEWPRRDP